LTVTLKIDKNRLYASVFEGDKEDGTDPDEEAKSLWLKHLKEDHILYGNKKDNFWEMGETGPCGPCSELHIDLRDESEIAKVPGRDLVNKDNPLVIEIWNLVFIQYNRKAGGKLELLPHKHVDTGMGFERLCMVVQGKKSNYDTDIFQPIIKEISKLSGFKYGIDKQQDIAMRVMADHLRTIAFAIADGQLPSNNKAGYVIRRILRRAVRYAYTFLKFEEPVLCKLLAVLIKVMGNAYPELPKQKELIEQVIQEEENAFLKTLDTGIRLLDKIIEKMKEGGYKVVKGKDAFELYDTFGFPFDLTELILREHGLVVSKLEFDEEMDAQKNRSRNAACMETDDWEVLLEDDVDEFIGYDYTETKLKITKYRKVTTKGKELYQLVFNMTPFYAESGGQVGDTGYLESANEKILIVDTRKENNLHMHISEQMPENIYGVFSATVDKKQRYSTQYNHSATHLLHKALREVLGPHVEQKGSLVHPDYLRFDFSHYQKMSTDEITRVEYLVNEQIRGNYPLEEDRNCTFNDAKKKGAMALFGEKYGEVVRVIKFGDSIELCGGTHTKATGDIGLFKITSEGAIAAGIRRIEAITGEKALEYVQEQTLLLKQLNEILKNPKSLISGVENIVKENTSLQKQLESLFAEKTQELQACCLK
ncbi:MAG: alanine--tRNA ligase, partial [Bacteroidetes bacterium]|nr:alanine--tRNA ligase [Bacteroidota bacterium]